ncbi:MAG: CsiV family protein [Gammaproteobacteria bacterium]
MHRIFLIPCLFLIALIGGPTALAQGVGAATYHVEVIVFRNAGAREGEPGAAPARSASGDAATGATQMARYLGPLPAAKLQLTGARQKLAASGYRVLAHTGWTQTASTWGSRGGLSGEQRGLQVPGLSGNFLLERGSLLHFGMNLRYAPEGGAAQQMNELRRIRFNEKNYYDHPGLGVIAVVTPGGR